MGLGAGGLAARLAAAGAKRAAATAAGAATGAAASGGLNVADEGMRAAAEGRQVTPEEAGSAALLGAGLGGALSIPVAHHMAGRPAPKPEARPEPEPQAAPHPETVPLELGPSPYEMAARAEQAARETESAPVKPEPATAKGAQVADPPMTETAAASPDGAAPDSGVLFSREGIPVLRIVIPERVRKAVSDGLGALRQAVREHAKSFVGKTINNIHDGSQIAIPAKGMRHGTSPGKSRNELLAALGVPEMLKNAVPVGKAGDKAGRKDIRAVHYYEAMAHFDGGDTLPVRLVVREHVDGKRYYDHYEIKKKAADQGPTAPPFRTADEGLTAPAEKAKRAPSSPESIVAHVDKESKEGAVAPSSPRSMPESGASGDPAAKVYTQPADAGGERVEALSQTGDARRHIADRVDPGQLAIADYLRMQRRAKGDGSWPPGSPSGEPLKASTADAGIKDQSAVDVKAHRAHLKRAFGKAAETLERIGKLKIVASDAELQDHLVAAGGQGAFDPKSGTVYLMAHNTRPEDAPAIVAHEFMHDFTMKGEGRALLDELAAMEQKAKAGSPLARWFEEARARVPEDTPEAHRLHEIAAYAVQRVVAGQERLTTIRRWVSRLLGKVKAWLIRRKFPWAHLDDKGLAGIAIRHLKETARRAREHGDGASSNGVLFARMSKDEVNRLLRSLAENAGEAAAAIGDGRFRTPIGEVRLGGNQLEKMKVKGRGGDVSLIRPTLERPIAVFRDEEGALIFLKPFMDDGLIRFVSVAYRIDGQNIVVSSYRKRAAQIAALFEKGEPLYMTTALGEKLPRRNSGSMETVAEKPDEINAGELLWERSAQPHAAGASVVSLDDIMAYWRSLGIDGFASEKNGVIHLSKIVVPSGKRNNGIGTKAMRALTAYADGNGYRVVLSPSNDYGGSKRRLISFYKRFGFVENKGRHKDYSVFDSMYRDPSAGGLTDAEINLIRNSTRTGGAAGLRKLFGEGGNHRGPAEVAGEHESHRGGEGDASGGDRLLDNTPLYSRAAEPDAGEIRTKLTEGWKDAAAHKLKGAADIGYAIGKYFYFKPAQVIRDAASPTAKKLADLIYKEHGAGRPDDFFNRRQVAEGRFLARVDEALEPLRGRFGIKREDSEAIIRWLNGKEDGENPDPAKLDADALEGVTLRHANH